MLIIVSAPSGSGKTTIVNKIQGKMTDLRRSVSYTTRPPREGETQGEDYLFISKDAFEIKIKKGDFVEWERIFDNYYGTAKEQIEKALLSGEDIILSIDVKGARAVRKEFPNSISVFVMPPSIEELASRLRKRNTEGEKQLALRLDESKKEIEAADEFDYMIINDDLDRAVDEMKEIISMERSKNREKKV
ncbi:MAG: guanylate kinase [Candidatus Omnitrophota bacterium]